MKLSLSAVVAIFSFTLTCSLYAADWSEKAGDLDQGSTWPKPQRMLGQIPVYEKFSDLEALLHLGSDTTYVINFWATWCKPCIEELPYFESFNQKYGDKRVKIILVSLDFPDKVESRLIPFIEKKKLKSTVIFLEDGKYNSWIDKVSPEWSGAIPVTYIYHGSRKVFVDEPFDSIEDLEKVVLPLL